MGRVFPDRQKLQRLFSSKEGIGGAILFAFGIAKFVFRLVRGGADAVGEIETVKELWPSLKDGALWVYNASSLNAVAMIAGAGLIWHSLRTPKAPPPEGALSATFKSSPPLPELIIPRTPSERIVANVTPDFLMDFFQGELQVEARKRVASYIGKWVNWSGLVEDITALARDGRSVSFLLPQPPFSLIRSVFMDFDAKWVDRISILNKGDRITVFGRIETTTQGWVQLGDCELTN
jgi:hypothetical protein